MDRERVAYITNDANEASYGKTMPQRAKGKV